LDIDGWLRGIGLAQYAEMFRANDIDGPLRDKRFGNAGSACGVTDIWSIFIRDGGHWKPRCTATLIRSYRQRRQLLRTE
jgi:SAM domain (Sterile alpha motif)